MGEVAGGALAGERYRVLVSTDIGGTDPDDFQSMVHYLLYADLFDTEGLISSPWGPGRKEHLLEVIDRYERDYERLVTYSPRYPTPEQLRSLVRQGAIERAPDRGYRGPTEGSEWIIHCARRDDPRPLYVLVWGLLEDVAQALHDDPGIAGRLRVYFIGGPNKKWGANAYEYIRREFPDLWIIENNSTYRGWFVGGDQSGDLGNERFVAEHVAGHGALGDYFAGFLGGRLKMGDTPSVAYLLRGTPEDPTQPSWGGQFVPVRGRPRAVFHRLTTEADQVEVYAVLELVLQGPDLGLPPDEPSLTLELTDHAVEGYHLGGGTYRVRYVSKVTGLCPYVLRSPIRELDGLKGAFTCVAESEGPRQKGPCTRWWSDLLDPAWREGVHAGARTVSQWRRHFLRDFQARLDRCQAANRGDGGGV